MITKPKTVAFLGVCTAFAMVLAYVEILLPPIFTSIPGIKMGLPNIIIVFLLYRYGPAFASAVSLVRIVLVSMLFGNIMAFMYSLAGAALSLIIMLILRRLKFLSTVGVSVCGAVCHNIGQILMAMFLLDTSELGYYLVVLIVTGTIAGVLIGLCAASLEKRVPKNI